jgi:acyl-CoA thioesterase
VNDQNHTIQELIANTSVEELHAKDKAAQHFGIRILKLAPGEATLSMRVVEWMTQGHNICHGGFIFTLADTAMAYASNSGDLAHVALNANIDFLNPVREGQELIALAAEASSTKKTGMYKVSVTVKNGPLIAEFRGRTYGLSRKI